MSWRQQRPCAPPAALATGGATTAFANGHSFKTYYKFGGGNDGAGPGALAADPQGNLYGTTAAGGANGQGTIFRIAPDGSETVLYSFSSPNNTPNPGPVILDNAGNLYGATVAGGGSGRGTVYKLAPDGTETLLYSFSGGSDGGNPLGGLIVDKAGTLYGATAAGGTDGWGTVFTLTPDGTETVLYSFTGSNDGAYPFGSLIRDKAGNFYGTAGQGGINGYGTAFKLARHGTLTVLHAFGAYLSDGQTPRAGLIADQYGNFYGYNHYRRRLCAWHSL
ncbi:MAG: choice-of-anchor tandem repeat GloVer-containing protein [Rhodospirillales bacterium]